MIKFLRVALLVSAVGLTISGLANADLRVESLEAAYGQISNGMSQAEVRAKIGVPGITIDIPEENLLLDVWCYYPNWRGRMRVYGYIYNRETKTVFFKDRSVSDFFEPFAQSCAIYQNGLKFNIRFNGAQTLYSIGIPKAPPATKTSKDITSAPSKGAKKDSCIGTACLAKPSQKPSPSTDKPKVIGSGTGFFVSTEGHIVTNHHVTDKCERVTFTRIGKEYEVTFLARDQVNDVSLLKADVEDIVALHIGQEKAELMEQIFVAGFPFGEFVSAALKVNSGIVSSLAGIGNNYSNLQIDAAIQQGNSGGPIINFEGNVVGIAVGKLSTKYFLEKFGTIPEGVNFGVKGTTVGNLLEANGVAITPMSGKEKSRRELSRLLTQATINLSCWGIK